MALNLSTLTSPATSGDVLAEALTTADFLEPVPVLRNLARGSNKGGDAEQAVALNQPKALPLIDGKGYLYLSGVSGNYVSVPSSTDLDVLGDIDIQATFPKIESNGATQTFMGRYASGSKVFLLQMTNSRTLYFYRFAQFTTSSAPLSEAAKGVRATHRVSDDRVQFFETLDGTVWTQVGTDKTLPANTPFAGTSNFEVGTWSNGVNSPLTGAIQRCIVKDGIDGTSVLDVDFTSTNVRHGATKFKCATGQVVTINQDSSSSNDVATIIKKSVLRFDGVNDFMDGLLNQTVTGGYMFAAFSVLGDGGSEGYGRILGLNSTGSVDSGAGGVAFRRNATTTGLMIRYNENNITTHSDFFDDERGDYLLEAKVLTGSQKSKINNADLVTGSVTGQLSAEEFQIAALTNGAGNRAAIDLEYLALFPATITDAQADAVRNYINNRNTVFYRWDTDGYYFFDPLSLAADAPVSSWNGQIVGSDNDANLTITQSTANSQPDRLAPDKDGMVVRFNDNNDHLIVPAGFVEPADGSWQVVGTSLGTFAYRVNANAVTELNLLGNAGLIRLIGDLYGIILLPESATGRDIEEARKLLIDRGASDAAGGSSFYGAWYERRDIVTFRNSSFPDTTNFAYSWENCVNLNNLETIHAPSGTSFVGAWRGTSALTSFPADAKLGTEAANVNFTSAWQSSGLTSFPSDIDLSKGTTFNNTWRQSGLTSFSTPLPAASDVSGAWYQIYSLTDFSVNSLPEVKFADAAWYASQITSFTTGLPKVKSLVNAWNSCSSLTDFSADVFADWNPSSISSGIFNQAWLNCSLTAQSVENILVSIDASGKHATSTGASGGTALADAGIDIDYNGDPLSDATTAAIDSLSGKGWQVYINGELVIPNILDLQPAAAYSLRSFDADADPNVINVRRSSDGATSDFTASEVSDGTLTDWVNTDVVLTSSDFASTLSPYSVYNLGSGSTELNQSIAGVDGALKWTIAADGFIRRAGTQTLGTGNQFKISVKVYIPSSNDFVDGIAIISTGLDVTYPSTTLAFDTWHTIEITGTATTDGQTNGFRIFPNNPASSVDDVLYVKDYDITQLTADGHVTTWYDQGGTNHATQSTASSQPKIVDGGTLVTEGGLAALSFDGDFDHILINHEEINGQSVLDSFYITSTSDTQYLYPTGNGYGLAAQSNNVGTQINSLYGSPTYYVNGQLQSWSTRGDAYTALNGYKLSYHRLADTTAWSSNFNTRFGAYASSANSWDYQGKLQEMIFFNTDQLANRTGIENNINDHFDIYS